MDGKGWRLAGAVAGALWLGACASRKPAPDVAAAGKPPSPAAAGEEVAHYVVAKGDSLWKIAAKADVLADPFRWPLLYRQNRDQIQDPDLIDIRQDLGYRRAYPRGQVEEAVRLARDTPPYQPHSVPRKTLPVKY